MGTEPHDMAAIVHVHSTYSGGTATVPEIIDAAADAEADVVLLTDHNALQARRDGHEGWHHGVLLLVGVELSRGSGHFELWNLVTEAAEACRTPRQLASFISRPEEAVDHPPQRNLAEWDRLCHSHRTVAIGGLDAHRSGLGSRAGTVLSPLRNARFFRMLRTHLLCERPPTGDLESDRRLILAALREGRCYLGRDSLAATRGFRFYADGPAGFLPMGGESTAGEWTLRARLPFEGRIRLIRNGQQIRAATASAFDVRTEQAGVYRVEGQLNALGRLRTWILSNPIYLR